MKRVLPGFLVGIIFGLSIAWGLGWRSTERTTSTRLSPDETLRASLVEVEVSSTERRFEVRLEDLVHGETTVLFRSPEVGLPSGSERLVWSRDGRWILLVGRHFFVKEDLLLDNGDQLYYLFDKTTKQALLNSFEPAGLADLTWDAVDGIDFTEPVRRKPR